MTNVLALLGRVLISAIFIQGGIQKALGATTTIGMFTRLHLPQPTVAYGVAVVVELLGGLAILLGWRVRPVAGVLALWCVATALIAHYHPGDRNQMIHFMKNLAMAGGFLQLAAWGAGRFSLDRR